MRPILTGMLVLAGLLIAGCGTEDEGTATTGTPTIAVTTNILGDVVDQLVGDLAEVEVIMPVGASPHDFEPSARQVDAMTRADALVTNGGGFEEGLVDTIGSVEEDGVPVHEAISAVDTLEFGAAHGHAQPEDQHAGEDEHAGEDVDPHFFTDPARMADAASGIADFLVAAVPALDTEAFHTRVEGYVDRLEALDGEIEEILASVPAGRRVMVTNHEVFGYFADRYDFEVVGTVIPGGSTSDGVGAGDLASLADVIREEQVPAIFAESSSPARLADTLAAEVGGEIEVVELYTESLGDEGSDGASYLDMMRTDAERIAAALG